MVIDYNIVHAALEANEAAEVAVSAQRVLRRLNLQDSDVNKELSALIDDFEIKSDALCSHLFSTMPIELQDYLQKCGIKGYHTTLLESAGLGHTCWGQNLRIQLENYTLIFHICENKWILDKGITNYAKGLDVPCEMSESYISTNFYSYNYKL